MDRIKQALVRFMAGRYGTDKLNMVLLTTGLVVSLAGLFVRLPVLNLCFMLLSYGLVGLTLYRTFSRNTYKRYQENRRFLQFFEKLKDRQHRYYKCPRCHQQVRVPKGKGKISITCPKCKEKFVKKT